MINSISLFDDKIDYLKGRISQASAQFKVIDDRIDEIFARLKKEIKLSNGELSDRIETVRDETRLLMNDMKESKNFVDFTNLRIDSFTNVIKQHTSDHIAHTEKLTQLTDN